jgi:hypothetical protein
MTTIQEEDGSILHIVSPSYEIPATQADGPVLAEFPSQIENATEVRMIDPSQIENTTEVRMIDPSQMENTTEVRMIDPSQMENTTEVRMIDPSQTVDMNQTGQVIIATTDGGKTYFTLPPGMQTTDNLPMETTADDILQQVTEEVISTQDFTTETGNDNVETTLSEIAFDQDGGISESTAANLAAMYGTDRIIYQEERNDGTEVVHVYAVVTDS